MNIPQFTISYAGHERSFKPFKDSEPAQSRMEAIRSSFQIPSGAQVHLTDNATQQVLGCMSIEAGGHYNINTDQWRVLPIIPPVFGCRLSDSRHEFHVGNHVLFKWKETSYGAAVQVPFQLKVVEINGAKFLRFYASAEFGFEIQGGDKVMRFDAFRLVVTLKERRNNQSKYANVITTATEDTRLETKSDTWTGNAQVRLDAIVPSASVGVTYQHGSTTQRTIPELKYEIRKTLNGTTEWILNSTRPSGTVGYYTRSFILEWQLDEDSQFLLELQAYMDFSYLESGWRGKNITREFFAQSLATNIDLNSDTHQINRDQLAVQNMRSFDGVNWEFNTAA